MSKAGLWTCALAGVREISVKELGSALLISHAAVLLCILHNFFFSFFLERKLLLKETFIITLYIEINRFWIPCGVIIPFHHLTS